MSKIIISCDPGVGGAICILSENAEPIIADTPTYKTKKGKTDYVLKDMANILKPYTSSDVLFVIEDVHAMVGNGGVSMFNFGRGKGLWEGIAAALGFSIMYVSPQTWKKSYDGLIVSRIDKDAAMKMTKKEKDKHKRLAKAGAKAKARELAGKMYPSIVHMFKQVNSDGRAEALLMACYGRNHKI